VNDRELLAFHREIVAIPSVSHQEKALCDHLEKWLGDRGAAPIRIGNNVCALAGDHGPILALNSHFDTVDASSGWTRPPHEPAVEDGKVYGLGSNDAKAPVAAMTAAFLRSREAVARSGFRLLLALVCEEETGGAGAELVVPELSKRGLLPAAAVVGEPTGLEIAVAQKGLLIVEISRKGKPCHAAHARALGVRNPIADLAADLVAVKKVDLGAPHALLGETTLEPTVVAGGSARNTVPGEATCILDLRTNPQPSHEDLVARLRETGAGIRVVSDRLRPYAIDADAPIVQAARKARPEAPLIGSRGVSDLVFFAAAGVPCIKVGPGRTERSHTANEFVLESEILEGARFYENLVLAYGSSSQPGLAGERHGTALGSR
jgi:acetylornithine deacetylase